MGLFQQLFKKSDETKRKDNPVPMRAYSLDEWNLKLDIPAQWEILFQERPNLPNYEIIGVCGPQLYGPKPSVLIMAQIVEDDGEGINAYMNNAEQQLGRMFRNLKMIKKSIGNYKGVPSAIMEYQYQANNGWVQELNVTAFFGGRIQLALQFICEANKETVKSDRIIQNAIINSLKIGSAGVRVPFLEPRGGNSSNCAYCGCSLSKPNATFSGTSSMTCLCGKCWKRP